MTKNACLEAVLCRVNPQRSVSSVALEVDASPCTVTLQCVVSTALGVVVACNAKLVDRAARPV